MGGMMEVIPFEKSCAACHDGDTTAGDRISFLGFPSIDVAALNVPLAKSESPRSIGTWIQEAPEAFPWPMIHLLSEDAREAWKMLRKADVKPFAPSEEALSNPETLEAIEKVVWGFKELARDLSQSEAHQNPSNQICQDELIRRLSEAGFDDAGEMLKGIPPDAFDAMRRGFSEGDYVKLLSEVDQFRDGKFPEAVTVAAPPASEASGEMPEGLDEVGDAGFGGEEEATFGDDGGEDAGFGGEEEATFGDDGGEDAGFGDAGDEEEATFGEEADSGFGGEETEATFGEEEDVGFGGEEVAGFGEESPEEESDEEAEEPKLDPIDPDLWASKGGWQQQYGVLYYRSTGHADPLIKSWLDGLAARSKDPLALAQLKEGFDFQSGVSSVSSGSCLKCHSVDEVRDEAGELTGAKIQWGSLGGGSQRRKATRFDHAPHLILADCRSCHQTREDSDKAYLSAFPDLGDWNAEAEWSSKANPLQFHSNFKELEKNSCSVCHDRGHVGDNCTQCHLYHHDD
jgi:hypothetical protein